MSTAAQPPHDRSVPVGCSASTSSISRRGARRAPYKRHKWTVLGVLLSLAISATSLAQAPKPGDKLPITDAERADLQSRIDRLDQAVEELKGKFPGDDTVGPGDALADVSVSLKAAKWIVKHGEFFAKDSVAKTIRVLDAGMQRASDLKQAKHPWTAAKGGVSRGFVSKIDGSVQPYAIYVPDSYDGKAATRLDVILHGRDATLTEVKFFDAHDHKPFPKAESGLVLHVYGRGNNAYRWAGEADVFEAIEAVKRNYRVDDHRILLRGFSMGGAGAWHLGLHHPDLWCAVEAGAGFSETKTYAKLKEIPDYQEKTLRIYDAVDYARNAFNVPIAGYGGEDDPQRLASQNIVEALEKQGVKMKTEGLVTKAEGLDFLRVVGAKMGHKIDPESEKILKAFRDDHAARGQDQIPKTLRFVTYTLKYNRGAWLSVESMKESYRETAVEAEIRGDTAVILKSDNVNVLAIDREVAEKVAFGDQILPLRDAVKGLLPNVYFRRTEQGWETLDYDQSRAFQVNAAAGKRHGLQGPIDDAFMGAFLCVRPTGAAWNPNVTAWSKARLERFAAEWSEFLRGDLPIKDDADVTPEDVESRHLILFGDPGSNRWIARILPDLPLAWSKSEFTLGDKYSGDVHAPTLIVASPLNRLKYVVINGGPSFGARDFTGTNALLFPRVGDWAVLKVGNRNETVETSGFFDERWKFVPAPTR